jgi:hypothetical protein
MSTIAPPLIKALASDWENKCGLTSAILSGTVGDPLHKLRGGYHISREDQPADNYSVIRPEDKPGNGPNDACAAIDMTMSTADMKTCTARLVKAFTNRDDPRRKYLNAFNGWSGTGDAQRWDVFTNKVAWATPDHKWHVHLEIRRKYVTSAAATKAILSILRGESVAAYLTSIGVTTTVTTPKPPPYPGRLLMRNDAQKDADPAVKLWQDRMIARGWASLGKTGDGFFGEATESVVKRFQSVCGVESDGVIGPGTWPLPWTRPLGA